MKVLYIITSAQLGGAQHYVLALASKFSGIIAAGPESDELFKKANYSKISTYRLRYLYRGINPIYDLLGLLELYLLIKKVNPDIVHLNSSKAGILGSIAGKMAGVKVIFTAHGFVFNEPRSKLIKNVYIIFEKIASYFRDKIITVSNFDRQSGNFHKIAPATKLITIHNGIGKIEFFPRLKARENLGLHQNELVLGTIANQYKTKGLDLLIEAISKIHKSNFVQIIIGTGPEESNIKALIKSLGLGDRVILAGQIEDAAVLLKAFDVFILPSRKEGLPLALLEAMQAGLPTIATDVGGNKELIGQTGIIVPPGNATALADAISAILDNPNQRQLLSENILERSKLFTEQQMFTETEKVYFDVMKLP